MDDFLLKHMIIIFSIHTGSEHYGHLCFLGCNGIAILCRDMLRVIKKKTWQIAGFKRKAICCCLKQNDFCFNSFPPIIIHILPAFVSAAPFDSQSFDHFRRENLALQRYPFFHRDFNTYHGIDETGVSNILHKQGAVDHHFFCSFS
ncbi:Uncharacterised protein [Mycobacteroides abscessus subsp. abscessus]|nr:Uncharacterised protein [Mycobacteroides abscessus subsp. abscessus]